jgi:hypothetical protein
VKRWWSRRWPLAGLIALGAALGPALYAQLPFREYPGEERESDDLPVDWNVPAEFVVARLMYPSRNTGDAWLEGGTNWTIDYPSGDRTFAGMLRRLTVVDVRSVEQPVNLDDGDDVFHWPFLYVVMPSTWELTDQQVAKLREYLLRGGFLLADSFFGTAEWEGFMESMVRVFPDRPVVELPDGHAVFDLVYDFSERQQINNYRTLVGGCGCGYRDDGSEPKWLAILDDDDRIMVAMSFNNDMGDSWQHADNPRYPQEDSYMGLRLGVNYVIYALTH